MALWYTYSTLHFTGWPTQQDPYALAPLYDYPDTAVVLTRIAPLK